MQIAGCPVYAWCMALWHATAPEDLLAEAWKKQVRICLKPAWSKVQGPAAAMALSLRRAEWSWPAHTHVLTRDKHLLNMKQVCPCDIMDMFKRDVEAVIWARWTQQDAYRHLAPAPHLQPVVSLLQGRRKGWTAHHANAARQVVVSGAVTQQTLHQWGMADSPFCRACGLRVGDAAHAHILPVSCPTPGQVGHARASMAACSRAGSAVR